MKHIAAILAVALFAADTHAGPEPSVGLYWYNGGDPTTGAGVCAPQWQLLIRTDNNAIYYKSGAACTAWTLIGTSGGGTITGGGTAPDLAVWTSSTGIGNYAGSAPASCSAGSFVTDVTTSSAGAVSLTCESIASAGGVTGTGTTNTDAIWTSSTSIGNGQWLYTPLTTALQTEAMVELCQTSACNSVNQWIWSPSPDGTSPAAGQFQETFPGAALAFGASVSDLVTATAIGSSQQLNQSLMSGTANTTAAVISTWAGEFGTDLTRSAGANNLINTALLIHAAGGQINYAIDSENGEWLQGDPTSPIVDTGSATIDGLTTLAGGVTVTAGEPATLGNDVANFFMPSGAAAAQLVIGSNAGFGTAGNDIVQIKNTGSQIFSGVGILGDTTVSASARPAVNFYRGASGGAGTLLGQIGLDNGTVTTANDLFIEGVDSIDLYPDTKMWHLTTKAHLALTGTQISTFSAGCGTPTIINATDLGGSFTSGAGATGTCTLTFVGGTWTTAPVCWMWQTGTATGTALTTLSATQLGFTVAGATSYSFRCECVGGSCT